MPLKEEAAKRRNQAIGRPQGQKSVPACLPEQTGEATLQAAKIVGTGAKLHADLVCQY
jgi:hypothetical protein